MPINDSRHLLPMNSMVFKSSPNLRNELPSNPTLVNIRDAADTSVTALPMPATALEDQVVERKMGWWSRMVARIKGCFKKKEEGGEERTELNIGGPTDFQHTWTAGIGPLRTTGVGEEGEWEDVDEGKGVRK
ncbi:hypothetical protein HBI56_118980 [Parastagonospora nodorum]|uniref:Uncharacterized protein n=1 Tax=Phaeosphaeria nodorum (strain SN15 / ATCC MYA-4574 / FGSC 10173) TaxID=321614 RepID=A0A7U2FDV9_PHANO|nr:hypothetical protein HBH56_055780 [Parastagonospora nodorum]QRD02424.1 hypothetical protein JI435_053820 [Parastagonospora nodorum SN15]KAH3935387.1 hypothetical protein HBH54_041590 [Parastagonospora nodorum]KAH3948627.1 hypothetical protein HBH53_097710 [Parastagonospora nodorum]KAH3989020.1 hypothetical protein HBH52_030220 [Parastagonospora nodorum]